MPNTLVHLCIQTPASRILVRDSDFKWIALGCIIPDIPWVLQRIILVGYPDVDQVNLKIYAVIQASLIFCLVSSLALSLLAAGSRRIFLLLSMNSFLHLLLDSLQTKWGNGVHFLAPLSWKPLTFSLFWPENVLVYTLSAAGLVVLLLYGKEAIKMKVPFTAERMKITAAVFLAAVYFLLPFAFFQGPVSADTHYIATLKNVKERPGKYIELDRRFYKNSDRSIADYSGEPLKLQGNIPEHDALLSVRGVFLDEKKIRVEDFHVHRLFRDGASMIGLAGVVFIWMIAIIRKKDTLKESVQEDTRKGIK